MAWYDKDSWLTAAFAPNLSTIVLTLIVAVVLPILLHKFLYRSTTTSNNEPVILLLGPSGSGKTAFATLTERSTIAQTHTSTTTLEVAVLLPESLVPASAHYRSPGDPAFERSRRFLLLDTPGHGKLRHYALSQLSDPKNVRAIVYVVDAAAVAEEAGLNTAAEYLHDVLLSLQKRYTGAKTSKGPRTIPVLIAANKLDLFTALPAHMVKLQLEKAIGEVRTRRAKALRDAGAALSGGEDEIDEEKEWLGEGERGAFSFDQIQQIGTTVDVVGGNVVNGKEAGNVAPWWAWIAEQL